MGYLETIKASSFRAGSVLCFSLLLLSALPSYPAQKDSSPAITELFKEAEQARLNGDFEHSIELFKECIAKSTQRSADGVRINAEFNLGILFWNTGDIEGAKAKFIAIKSLILKDPEAYRQIPIDDSLKIMDLYVSGKHLRSDGKLQEAKKCFETAIKLSQEIHIKEFEVKCNRFIGLIEWDLSEYRDFFLINKHNLEMAASISHKREEAQALNNLGAYYWKIGSFIDSMNYFEKARLITKEFNFKTEFATASSNLGGLYADLGDYGKSLDYIQETIEVDKSLNDKANMAYDLTNLGYTTRLKAIRDNDYLMLEKARDYCEQALKAAREAKNEYVEFYAILNLGTVYSLMNIYDKAIEYYRQAEDYAVKKNDMLCLGLVNNNLGIIYGKMGNTRKSLERFEKAIQVASLSYAGAFAWETYLEIGNQCKAKEDYEGGLRNYQNAVSLIEDTRGKIVMEELKASYLGGDRRMDVYQNIIETLVRLDRRSPGRGYDKQAFNYLERGKARAFLDSLEVADIDITNGVNPDLVAREKILTREISGSYTKLLAAGLSAADRQAIQGRIKSSEEQLDALKQEIRTTDPAYADLKYPKILDFAQARKLIPDNDTVFLAYSIGDGSSWSFLLTRRGLKVFELPGRKEIKEKVVAYRKTISDPDSQDFSAGLDLYRMLIPAGLEKTAKKLVVIPDDILTLLPFEALPSSLGPRRWLVEDLSISYTPSLSTLQVIEKRRSSMRPPNRPVFAMGDPVYNNGSGGAQALPSIGPLAGISLDRLRYSGLEVRRIGDIFKAGKNDLLLGDKATEDNLKAARLTDYKVIHIAAHAFVDDKNPLRSSIVLTLDQDPAEDGLLQMREIYNLKLNADLVTLSACQTGLGQFIRGEGISGISRAFFYAGASAVCMSLWAVNDEATFQMMDRFYLHLDSGQTVEEALRRTKIEMIGSGVLSHPYYWAPFIVSGDAGKTVFPKKTSPVLWLALPFIVGFGTVWTARNLRSRKPKHGRAHSSRPSFSNNR